MSAREIMTPANKIAKQYLPTTSEGGYLTNPLTENIQCAGFSVVDATALNGLTIQSESMGLPPGSAALAITATDSIAISSSKSLQFLGTNQATITNTGSELQFNGNGLLINKFDGDIEGEGNITSAPPLGGSAVLNGGLAEVTIGAGGGNNPTVRFQNFPAPDATIMYDGTSLQMSSVQLNYEILDSQGNPGLAGQVLQSGGAGVAWGWGGNGVTSVVAGSNIYIDATNPAAPVVNLSTSVDLGGNGFEGVLRAYDGSNAFHSLIQNSSIGFYNSNWSPGYEVGMKYVEPYQLHLRADDTALPATVILDGQNGVVDATATGGMYLRAGAFMELSTSFGAINVMANDPSNPVSINLIASDSSGSASAVISPAVVSLTAVNDIQMTATGSIRGQTTNSVILGDEAGASNGTFMQIRDDTKRIYAIGGCNIFDMDGLTERIVTSNTYAVVDLNQAGLDIYSIYGIRLYGQSGDIVMGDGSNIANNTLLTLSDAALNLTLASPAQTNDYIRQQLNFGNTGTPAGLEIKSELGYVKFFDSNTVEKGSVQYNQTSNTINVVANDGTANCAVNITATDNNGTSQITVNPTTQISLTANQGTPVIINTNGSLNSLVQTDTVTSIRGDEGSAAPAVLEFSDNGLSLSNELRYIASQFALEGDFNLMRITTGTVEGVEMGYDSLAGECVVRGLGLNFRVAANQSGQSNFMFIDPTAGLLTLASECNIYLSTQSITSFANTFLLNSDLEIKGSSASINFYDTSNVQQATINYAEINDKLTLTCDNMVFDTSQTRLQMENGLGSILSANNLPVSLRRYDGTGATLLTQMNLETNGNVTIGDGTTTAASLSIQNSNGSITSFTKNAGNALVINNTTELLSITSGSLAAVCGSNASLNMNSITNNVTLDANGGTCGLQLSPSINQLYATGGTDVAITSSNASTGKASLVRSDSTNGSVTITTDNTTGALVFNGTALQSATSGGSAGTHLVITLNGNVYKIKLENP